MMVRGYSTYRRSFRNQLDSTITIGAFIAVLGATAYQGVSFFTIMRRVLLIFRLFWLPRNLRYVFESKGIKKFAKLCWRIVGKTMTLGVVFLCILYAFAAIGTFAFGGLINRDPSGPHYEALMSSRYASDGYFPLNFNDFMSSLITVFACLHVSDFDVIAEGMVVTSSTSARLYFAMWYVVGVLLMLNILKSFFLDEFLAVFSATAAEDKGADKEVEAGDEEGGVKKIDAAFSAEESGGADMEGHVLNPLVGTPMKETRPVMRSLDVALDPHTTTEPFAVNKDSVDVSGGSVVPAVAPAVPPAATAVEEAAPAQEHVAGTSAAPAHVKAAKKGPAKTPKLPPPAVAPPAAPAAHVPAYAPPPPPPLPSMPPPAVPLSQPHYIPASVGTGPHLLYGLEEVEEEDEVGAAEEEEESPEGLLLAPAAAPIEDGYVEVSGDGSDATGPVYMGADTQDDSDAT
jgi:hypothetical protein